MKKMLIAAIFLVSFDYAFGAEAWRLAIPVTPDLSVTPGDRCSDDDIDFVEYRYNEQMPYCRRNVWDALKNRVYKAYSIPEKCRHRYTIDHMVPLALGGSNNEKNLWPEHHLVKATRQALENELYWKVRAGTMSSDSAVQILYNAKVNLNLDLSDIEGCG
jgi:hypothetical protein